MLTREEKYMREALKQAKKAYAIGEVPIGAVLVFEDRIIARGYNRRNTDKSSLGHAEISVITKGCKFMKDWRLENCEMYVTVEPCPMCAGAIIQSRVKKDYYGATNKKAGSVESLIRLFDIDTYNHKVEYESGVLGSECGQLMSDFFRDLRKKKDISLESQIH